jgi:hypothetical protein
MATLTTFDASTNKDLFKTILLDLFDNTTGKALVEWKSMFKEVKTKDDYERSMRIAGMEYPGALGEGEPISMMDPTYGGTKEWSVVAYGGGFRVSDRLRRFNKYNLYEKWSKNLAKNMDEVKDVTVANLWNSATATTYASGYDSLALAHNTHTCLDAASTSYDNYGAVALSHTALKSALQYFDYMYNDMGQIMVATPSQLNVNYALRFTANEILRSDKVAHQLDNTKNVLPDLKVNVYHRYTSTTAWSLTANNNEDYDVKVFTAMSPDREVHDAFDDTRDVVMTSLQYFTYGFGDPRMVYIGNV